MPEDAGAPGPPEAGELRWRVNPALTWLKIAVAALFLVAAAAFADDVAGPVVAAVAAAALLAYAARDLLAPVRLAADPTGVTVVSGFAGRHHLPWAQIDRVRVDERRRLGVRSQLLEIDSGETLHLFSSYELSASCEDVAALLEGLRLRAAG